MQYLHKHPCYSSEAQHKYARIHLPVAPLCNISCNYCNRKYDCQNESRPGVTSDILNPVEALERFITVKEKIENLSVVGIAGPGDALANWEKTKMTLELIRRADREVYFCLSTNGLLLPEFAGEIHELGVKHVTVTVNCLEPAVGAKIYRQVNYREQTYYGAEGVEILIANQLKGIELMASKGALVKVNIVLIEGINDHHVRDVVTKVKSLGAATSNIMPLIPTPGSAFEEFGCVSEKKLHDIRKECELDLKQIFHCRQCRADAIGMLRNDRRGEFGVKIQACSVRKEAV